MQSQSSQRVPMARFPAFVAIMRRFALPLRLNRVRRTLVRPARLIDIDLAQLVRESGEW